MERTKKLIRDYIIKRRGKATKNDVVDFMNNEDKENAIQQEDKVSRVPVLSIIHEMEKKDGEIIVDRRENRPGQPHYLVFNDSNTFKLISDQLDEIETMIEKAAYYKPRRKDFQKPKVRRDSALADLFEFEFDIQLHFNGIIDTMLDAMLVKTQESIKGESNRHELFDRIVRLKLKSPSKLLEPEFIINLLDHNIDTLIQFKQKVLSYPIDTQNAKDKSNLYHVLIGTLVKTEENFVKRFLENPTTSVSAIKSRS